MELKLHPSATLSDLQLLSLRNALWQTMSLIARTEHEFMRDSKHMSVLQSHELKMVEDKADDLEQ